MKAASPVCTSDSEIQVANCQAKTSSTTCNRGGRRADESGEAVSWIELLMGYEKENAVAESIGVLVARRHIFLCCDQTKPKCCDKDRGLAAWDYLKARLK